MCRGCALRERLMRRTHQSLEAAVAALGAAHAQGFANAHLSAGGLEGLRAIVVDCACFTTAPAPPQPAATHRRAVAAPKQLSLGL